MRGILPSGVVSYISDVCAGRNWDKKITKHYGILSLLKHGDGGFDIESDLLVGVTLNISPF